MSNGCSSGALFSSLLSRRLGRGQWSPEPPLSLKLRPCETHPFIAQSANGHSGGPCTSPVACQRALAFLRLRRCRPVRTCCSHWSNPLSQNLQKGQYTASPMEEISWKRLCSSVSQWLNNCARPTNCALQAPQYTGSTWTPECKSGRAIVELSVAWEAVSISVRSC